MARTLAVTLLLLASCSNYDFAAARGPDGVYDMKRLIADLEASGQPSLTEGHWIPLAWLEVTVFRRSDPGMPNGYTLTSLRALGPLFAFGSSDAVAVDEHGTWLDTQDRDWGLWGLGWFQHYDWSMSTSGRRLRSYDRVLLWAADGIHYATAAR